MIHKFPYDRYPGIEVPDANISGVYTLPDVDAPSDGADAVRAGLASPIGAKTLREDVQPGMRVTLTVDDSSRDTRTEVMLPIILKELHETGVRNEDIKVFIALGTHRKMTHEEMERKYTQEAVARYAFINPDWRDTESYITVDHTSSGFPIKVHKEILDTDYLIGVGQTIPHMIAGFGGGCKIVIPGCADEDTIGEMHWRCNEVPSGQLFAVRENAVRDVIDEAAIKAGLKYIINEVPASGGRIARVFAGHPVDAHKEACKFALDVCTVRLKEKTDIVLADAYPADLDFWQALKGLYAAYGAVRKGGTVILVTPCPEGASAQHPELTTLGYIPSERTRAMTERGELDKCIAANLYLGRQIIDHANVILVTEGIPENDTRAMGFDWASDPASALSKAFNRHGDNASINILYKASKMICVK
ncbi:MAG: nickel-dependent lactate racemase family protein [Armatimonadota bacterium]